MTNTPDRTVRNQLCSRDGGPVSLLGLLLGVIQGHLKKSKQRQGQIENSRDWPNFAKT